MGELLVQLTDIYFKRKQELKRKPFSDRSNFSIMGHFEEPAERKKPFCCLDKCKLSKHPDMEEFKELKVVLRRYDNEDLCSSNKKNNKLKANTVESTNSKVHSIKELQVNLSLSPKLMENFKERRNLVINNLKDIKEFSANTCSKEVNIENDANTVNIHQSSKDNAECCKVHFIKELQVNLSLSLKLMENFNERRNLVINKLKDIKEFSANTCSKEVNIENDANTVNIYQSSKDNAECMSGDLINHVRYQNRFANDKEIYNNDIQTLQKNTPIFKKLRKREKKNYLEISSTCLQDKSTVDIYKKKVPIYKQFEVKEVVNNKDPYELDISDFEEKKNLKKKFSRRNLSEKFDKTMYEIIKKLEQKNKKIKKKSDLKKLPQYDSNIKSVLQRVMKKVDGNKNESKYFNNPLDTGQVQIDASPCHNLPQNKPENVHFKNNQNNDLALPTPLVPIMNNNKNPSPSQEVFNNLDNGYVGPASPLSVDNHTESDEENLSLGNDLHEENGCFGFDDTDKQLAQCNKRINIISNVQLKNSQKSPWRLDGVRNSNYVIHYKKNSLPCLDQDIIVNYNISQRAEESFSQNNTTPKTLQKSHIQKSILDYVDSSQNINSSYDMENRPDNVFHHSLYNYEEFDTNYSTTNVNRNRKILGEIQENILVENVAVSTPVKYNTRTMPPLDVSVINNSEDICHGRESEITNGTILAQENNSNFGFDSAISEIEVGKKYSNERRPFRISMETIKKYKKCNLPSDMDHGESLPSVLIHNEPENNSSEDIGIFDDVEPELLVTVDAPIQYGRKGKRRQRLASVTSTCSDDEKPKKKKKNAMTKVEEEEFEKWAAQFNAMCSEIEKHNLEIE